MELASTLPDMGHEPRSDTGANESNQSKRRITHIFPIMHGAFCYAEVFNQLRLCFLHPSTAPTLSRECLVGSVERVTFHN